MLIRNNFKATIYFLKQLKWSILLIVVYAIVASLFDHSFIGLLVNIPIAIPTVIATLISLLLAFRTAQSYDRWWEARKVWGEIVNDSRTLVRQIMLFIPTNSDKNFEVKNFANRQIIWCYALAETLRRQKPSNKVTQYIKTNEIKGQNTPLSLLQQHSESLFSLAEKYSLNNNVIVQLDTTIARLTDEMGKCERIKNTIFPKNYSILIHSLIYIFASLLPFGLSEINIVTEIILTALLPILFIAFEKTAIIMQDPFEDIPTDVPMTLLCKTIERNINELIGETNLDIVTDNKNIYYLN